MGRWWWCSSSIIWLLLLLVALLLSSVLPKNVGQATKVVFDCTQVINELLLLNNNSNQASSRSLLEKALNESVAIYYEWDESAEYFFPEKFLGIVELLQSVGWELGEATEGKELLLTFRMSKSLLYFQRLQNQSIENDTEMYELLLPKFEKIKLRYNQVGLPIAISFSTAAVADSCELFAGNENVRNSETWAVATHRLINATTKKGIAVVEFSENQLDCTNLFTYFINPVSAFLSVDFVIAERLPESYGLFSELMNSLVDKNEQRSNQLGIRTRTRLGIHRALRLQLKKPSSSKGTLSSSRDKHIERGYAALLSRFAGRWASETGKFVIIQATEPIISNWGGTVEELVPSIRDNVIPHRRSERPCDDRTNYLISTEWPAQTTQRFNRLYVTLYIGYSIADCVKGLHWCAATTITELGEERICNNSDFQLHGNNSLKMLIEMGPAAREASDEEKRRKLEGALREFKKYSNTSRLPIHAILLEGQILNRNYFSQVIEDSKSLAEQIGCVVAGDYELGFNIAADNNYTVLADRISRYCKLPQVNLVIFDIGKITVTNWANIDFSRYTSEVQPRLSVVSSAVRKLQNSFPSVSVVLKFPYSGISHKSTYYDTIFCSADVESANKIAEALVTWSYIHKLPIILKEVVSDAEDLGWWDRLDAAGSWSGAYVTRNHPKTMGYLKLEPCLERHQGPPQVPIRMLASRMGCTVHVPEEVGPQELQVMLDFALHKFSNVEIIGSNFNVLIPQLEHALLTVTKPAHIFLQVPLENLALVMQSQIIFQVSKRVRDLATNKSEAKISIQISNLKEIHEPDLEDDLQTFVQHSIAMGVTLGVVVDNCTGDLVDNAFIPSKTFSHFTFSVCARKKWYIQIYYENNPIEDFNYFKPIGRAMDQLYAIKTVFQRKFPDKEIYFRPEFLTTSTPEFLRTLWDVNEHAKLYNMNYFAVNAFEFTPTDKGTFRTQGWWRVENLTTLAHPSNYVERESEQLHLVQWRPPIRLPHQSTAADTTFSWWVFVPSVVGFIMVVAALVLFAVWKRSESRYLTRIEELEFLNGVSSDIRDLDASTANQYLKVKFEKNYEIPKTNLKSEEATVIGAGNFGVVYKAIVKGALVAIKIPKEGCSPDLFKTTLQEIKIMCYVGCHENVVRFVGAYVKEIGRGIVQIASELCENGTLLAHLRGLSRSIARTEASRPLSQLVAVLDLDRICLEVASGMEFLSNKRVIHGDLATRNVLLDEHFTCKIGDFGLSRKLYEYEKYVKQSQEPLPWRWLAVEALEKLEFSCKSDVWSYGVTVWEIYSLGNVPYPGLNWNVDFVENLRSGLRLQKPKFSTDELYGKLLDCWNIEPEARPTFSELCQYFRTIRDTQYTAMEENVQKETE